jgi:hypothetical protein
MGTKNKGGPVHVTSIHLSVDMWEQLVAEARASKSTTVAVVRRILTAHFERNGISGGVCPVCLEPTSAAGATHTACLSSAMLKRAGQ